MGTRTSARRGAGSAAVAALWLLLELTLSGAPSAAAAKWGQRAQADAPREPGDRAEFQVRWRVAPEPSGAHPAGGAAETTTLCKPVARFILNVYPRGSQLSIPQSVAGPRREHPAHTPNRILGKGMGSPEECISATQKRPAARCHRRRRACTGDVHVNRWPLIKDAAVAPCWRREGVVVRLGWRW